MPSAARFAADLAESAQVARDRVELRRSVAGRLKALVGCDAVYWGQPMDAPVDADCVFDAPDEASRQAISRFAQDRRRYDVPEAIRATRARGGVALGHELFAGPDVEHLPLYAEILRPAGIRSYVFCELTFRGVVLSTLTLSRQSRGSAFGSREKDLVCSVKPSLGLVEAAFGLTQRASSSAGVVERLRGEHGLSPREAQIATLVARGLGNKEIARLLGTALDTVRKQTIRIYDKLRVSGRVELAARLSASHGPNGGWSRGGPRR